MPGQHCRTPLFAIYLIRTLVLPNSDRMCGGELRLCEQTFKHVWSRRVLALDSSPARQRVRPRSRFSGLLPRADAWI